MIRATKGLAGLGALLLSLAATQAQAGLTLCNRTSYRVEAAIGLEKRANVATRGWFRVDPDECKMVLDGTLDADMVYVHARTPPLDGNAPMPHSGQAELCVRNGDFEIADGRGCPLSQQARFSAARPADAPNGPTVNLAEDADYDDTQARLAGIQRLLTIDGYDAYPIDGVPGAKTQAALTKFLADRKLPADAAAPPAFFDTLIEAVRDPAGRGFTWCNDIKYTVMAALGVVEMGAIVTRGWYRVDESGARRRARQTAGPQAHPHQRHAQARRRGDAEAGRARAFRGRVRHRRRRARAEAVA